ncbi:MAG TPA: hypothetical protein VFW19_10700 [Allosphingosinicella sp.]|nr:hypothetical protein [Allosphingosinicella sp.]
MKIGDTFPFPSPDREAVRIAKMRRGQLEAAAASPSVNGYTSQARVIVAGLAANAERAADPVEQAKLHLRRRGWNVFSGTVLGYRDGTYVVGTRLYTKAELLALAERQGWKRT